MQTVEDISYGVIPLKQEGSTVRVFLIHQFGFKGDVYWTFPKGHPKDGETPQESALRELKEETGLSAVSLDVSKSYDQTYSFRHEDLLINKHVRYYIGFVADETYTIQEDEVKEAGWFTCKEAYEKLTYEPAKEMFKQLLVGLKCPLA